MNSRGRCPPRSLPRHGARPRKVVIGLCKGFRGEMARAAAARRSAIGGSPGRTGGYCDMRILIFSLFQARRLSSRLSSN